MSNKYVYWTTIGVIVLVLWMFADYPLIGHMLIGLYVLLVFWQTISSQQVMRLALVALGVSFVAVVLQNLSASSAFSAYAFSLFVVGIAVLVKELWRYSLDLRKQSQKEVAAQKGIASHMD